VLTVIGTAATFKGAPDARADAQAWVR